jgi:hypothetical protein
MSTDSLQDNQFVNRPIPRIDSGILKKSPAGRKKRFTPTKMKNSINNYFEQCELTDDIPSIKGLMIFLKMYRDQFYTYLEYPEFNQIMEHARLIISNWAENDVYRTKGIAAGKIAYMKNVHDWTEKVEQNQNIKQTITNVEQAKAKIEMLAPKLLELLKNNGLVNQLALDNKIIEAEEEPRRI